MLVFLLSAVPFTYADDSAAYELVQIVGGTSSPTAILQSPGDDNRLFITTLNGKVLIVEDGALLETPFLDISANITTAGYGQGLHNLAFHPDYAANGYFYLAYTQADENAVIIRYQVSVDDPNRADPASASTIITLLHPTDFHYGGGLAFGPDGYLYWSMGDGAYKRSPAQDFESPLGSVMRLDVNSEPYAMPPDNPFVGQADIMPELWAKGLRNPWRISFDRATGDLYIADVGEASFEEINFQPAGSPGGENYGWKYYEGTNAFDGGDEDGLTFPVVQYPHDNSNCSITGGYVYRGNALPELSGKYVFGDYCSGYIWTTYQKTPGNWYTAELLNTDFRIITFGEDNSGELYLGDGKTSAIYKLVAAE